MTFNYYPSENKKSFKFFFDCLTRECFKREDNISSCRIIIDDQVIDLITVLPEVLLQVILQSCN